MKKVNRSRRIVITTGDSSGIGQEVTFKALLQLPSRPGCTIFVFTNPSNHPLMASLKSRALKRWGGRVYYSLNEALGEPRSDVKVRIIEKRNLAPHWVEEAARECLAGRADALVTAPLSKTLIKRAGLQDIGHTEILSRVCKIKKGSARMAFLGAHFNVVLASGHLPLRVAAVVKPRDLLASLLLAEGLRPYLSQSRQPRPIGLVGINPHAGEDGIIGTDEKRIFLPAIQAAKRMGVRVTGPLVPDAAFLPENWARYAVYVCPYHDQGLIPFKMAHRQQSGCHLTLGLPMIRTSVDHGTATDIFGQNKADPGSMLDAIKWAIRLASNRQSTFIGRV